MRHIIEIEDMSKEYKMGEVIVRALRDVSLTIEPDQVTVILGPSGCGKTTLLNQIGGIDSPTGGSIRVEGNEIAGLSQRQLTRYRQKKIGFIFQFFNLIPNLTAVENIEFVLEYVMDMSGREARGKARKLLEMVGLDGRENHYPFQLSGGEQQRVAIARALVKRPDIVLADEPTGNLDWNTGKKIAEVMRELNRREGITFVVVSHDVSITDVADRTIRLMDGQLTNDDFYRPVSKKVMDE